MDHRSYFESNKLYYSAGVVDNVVRPDYKINIHL